MRRARLSVGSLVVAIALSGCGAASEDYEVTGIDELEIPTPSPDPDDFVGYVDNPWFPLEAGSTWTYEDRAGQSTSTVTVEPSNLVMQGVPVTVVKTLTEGRLAAFDFTDYYAQDEAGNVWWFGRQGVWDVEASGEAGLAMPADPRVGDGWRRGYQESIVEDRLTVISLEGNEVVLRQESDLQPGAVVELTYAKGYGLISSAGPEGTSELTAGP